MGGCLPTYPFKFNGLITLRTDMLFIRGCLSLSKVWGYTPGAMWDYAQHPLSDGNYFPSEAVPPCGCYFLNIHPLTPCSATVRLLLEHPYGGTATSVRALAVVGTCYSAPDNPEPSFSDRG